MNAAAKGPFGSVHARALCHATEERERVELAVLNTIGGVELETSRTHGHHGNEILVIEAHAKGSRHAEHLFDRLCTSDMEEILSTIEIRTDESCNLFIRIDKQRAFGGEVTLARDDDAVAVRIKVAVFPAKKPLAVEAVHDFLVSRTD